MNTSGNCFRLIASKDKSAKLVKTLPFPCPTLGFLSPDSIVKTRGQVR